MSYTTIKKMMKTGIIKIMIIIITYLTLISSLIYLALENKLSYIIKYKRSDIDV